MQKKKIIHEKGEIIFTITRNRLSKRLRLSVNSDGEVKVIIPNWLPEKLAENFIISKVEWIIKKKEEFKKITGRSPKLGISDYKKNKEKARTLIKDKVIAINKFYDCKIGSIMIRNQKTRWGSCSGKGNLNFNYKIIFLPDKLADYIITHEICHIKEMNHSKNFWKLVAKTIPEYQFIKKELKKYKI
ncbi:M48 family metallopeptidase [bacterium]|nr:M48 family metallopeptidase [bacterium]